MICPEKLLHKYGDRYRQQYYIGTFETNESLTEINLSQNQLATIGTNAVSHLSQLEKLLLNHNRLADGSMQKENVQIKLISLNQSRIDTAISRRFH